MGSSRKIYYRSIFISDIHLGFADSKIDLLLDFLEHTKSEYLYVVGDFVDFIHLHEHHGWSKKCNEIIRRMFSKVHKGTKIRICIGNHDAFFGILSGFQLGNIHIAKEFLHENKFCDYLVCHGDVYDKSMKWSFLSKIVSFCNSHFYWFSQLKRIRKIIDKIAERNINKEAMREDILKHGAFGIIYGHTHFPYIDKNEINCGDWVEHCSAIVETTEGQFELIKWKENV